MASKKANRAIPYQKIAALAEQGLTALEIAKKTNRTIKGSDPTHSIRAILSRMRTHGYEVNGKTVKLKVERVGKKIARAAKAAKAAVEKSHRSTKRAKVHKHTPKPQPAVKLDGKQLASGEKE